jgi:DNA-binding MarR family transcriptional regulator
MRTEELTLDAARSMERLRLAESRLARRRQAECGPSENARAAMRFILERADAGDAATPRGIAEYLGISSPSVSAILDRLHAGGMIAFEPHPQDRRSKLVVPFDRSTDIDQLDPLTARIRDLAEELSPDAAAEISRFLDMITDAVERECA